MRPNPFAIVVIAALVAPPVRAEPIQVGGRSYVSDAAYYASDAFRSAGARCATPATSDGGTDRLPASDCTASATVISSEHDPVVTWQVPVVVHVLMHTSGSGAISDALIDSQIQVLNEDFRALPGSLGEPGTDVRVQFVLAGVTRTTNNAWYEDNGAYYNALAWDPNLYCNIYTNNTNALGYVPYLPQSGPAGSSSDRIVCYWRAFGKPALGGPPFDLGRTVTHEMGHYFGLEHTFNGACGVSTAPSCYATGDLICDTEPEIIEHFGCPQSSATCLEPDPIHNYLNYTDDDCMNQFTPEQTNRMRCTLAYYRPNVYSVAVGTPELSVFHPYRLHQNRPNPFNPATEIAFELFSAGPVTLLVLDVTGRIVRTLVTGSFERGAHRVSWDGTDDARESAPSGVYFYRLRTDTGSQTRRMVLIK